MKKLLLNLALLFCSNNLIYSMGNRDNNDNSSDCEKKIVLVFKSLDKCQSYLKLAEFKKEASQKYTEATFKKELIELQKLNREHGVAIGNDHALQELGAIRLACRNSQSLYEAYCANKSLLHVVINPNNNYIDKLNQLRSLQKATEKDDERKKALIKELKECALNIELDKEDDHC